MVDQKSARASATANDPFFSRQWALARVEAAGAWDLSATGAGVDVAVIGTGVDLEHEDLQCPQKLRVFPGADLVDDGHGVDDRNGHGTHVAGIIAACTNNGIGIAGVAPDATIVPYQVLDAAGRGSFAWVADAIRLATDNGAHIINLSLTASVGPISYVPEVFSEVDAALEHAHENGVVVVAGAGNSGLPVCEYPGIAENVICVGATDARDLKAWNSTFPVKLRGSEPGPAVVAPGGIDLQSCSNHAEAVFSSFTTELDTCADGALGYRTLAGTSMASAHVAGVAAVLYGLRATERSADNETLIVDAILDSAEDLGPVGYDPAFGYGMVDAHLATLVIPRLTFQAPSEVGALAISNSTIDLSWTDNSPNEAGFRIERSTDGVAFTEVAATTSAVTTFRDTNLEQSRTYLYRVRAFDATGVSDYSNVAAATTSPNQPVKTAPSSPSNLVAAAQPPSNIQLTWSDNASNENGYTIERSVTATEGFKQISTVAKNASTYADSGLQSGTYYYRIRAHNTIGFSNYSNVAAATLNRPLVAPSNLTAVPVSSSEIELMWDDSNNYPNHETGFRIERSADGQAFTQVTTVGGGGSSNYYRDTGLTSASTYHYRVRAYRDLDNSDYSNVTTATAGRDPSPGPVQPMVVVHTLRQPFGVFLSYVQWTVTASGGSATATRISSAWLEDRLSGWSDRIAWYPSESTGPIHAVSGLAAGSGSGGTEHWTDDVWMCWKASARFSDGVVVPSSGCQRVD